MGTKGRRKVSKTENKNDNFATKIYLNVVKSTGVNN